MTSWQVASHSRGRGDLSRMILRRLDEAGPMPLDSAAASIMPLVPFAYVARQGKGSALSAAKVKLRSLQAGGWVQISAGVVTVQRTERRGAKQ